ncbi:gliding motility-associated C-terminal domain-containing protein [Polaribacter sp. KT25b]|nr:gliding motility-associated C-terminal domain-containing protein [Polaribacter sp. KT25b]
MIKMTKTVQFVNKIIVFLLLMLSTFLYSQTDNAPSITADGRQVFCTGNAIYIVTDFSITDIDDTTIETFFIQISTGYQVGFDKLEVSGIHPSIRSTWSSSEGKLTLTSSVVGLEMLLTDLESAVKDVVFTSSTTNVVAEKFFSLSIGDANYLPSTDHFYEFVDNQSITWSDAKIAAENRTYFGRQGYLATLTSKEEADFAGKQASGAGWIGGSDAGSPDVWKWVTGPEAGTIFWNGGVNGSSPNFAFWNTGEPNNFDNRGEDYVHITAPGIGVSGAWNDLTNIGDDTGDYEPKGYIVEYGIPTDSPINIVATTSIYIPQILSTTTATICESGSTIITATPSEGEILWFDASSGGTQLAKGTSYTTANLTTSTTFYATISVDGCTTLQRTPITVTVNQIPVIIATDNDLICSGTANLKATASAGQVNWYESLTSTIPLFTGTNYTTPDLNVTTTYYVAAINADCNSVSRTPVTAVVDATIPEFDVMQNTYVLCNDVGSVTLETTNQQGNYTYVWKKDGVIISGNTTSNTVSTIGDYTVSAISDAGCTSEEKAISVINSEIASITKNDFIIVENSNNNTIYVNNPNLGIGNYEFALDDEFGIYRNVGFFEYISTGIHTLYIKDTLECGTQEYQFAILGYPRFFTPNEDGDNDIWKIEGYNKDFYTVSEVYIYDRFGKLIYTIDKNSDGWNGDSNNGKAPSNDYWFKTILTDINGYSVEKTGNFSLIRK